MHVSKIAVMQLKYSKLIKLIGISAITFGGLK